ncbi:component of SufBCD complex [Alisedimentitalea sp. MJ-SS2]|uniref:component of SufBCD complex n=1 Tax=Aliisedimentitalea sp. MJ-SS2 TaxID=3049795 RepID=UPI00290FAC28|nr:component of SufBCD complex [Alisedimentitalea sp. MJ-SS2]MDU8926972.1 component of SufBCD complex [Alisedimentitalea sp. MJ-SS2]
MDWYDSVFTLIDMRSFSNLWFWIALAVVWSTASHWVLGVPWDMVLRARREGGQYEADLEDLIRIYTNRLLYIARISGLWLLGFACFFLTLLAGLGFFYAFEFGQAVFLLAFPMTLVGALSLNTARLIQENEEVGEALYRRLLKHRIITQVIGMISIFITALWGMFQNLNIGPFG